MSLLKLTWQKSMGWILFIPFCGTLILIMKFWRRYRIENHDEIRRQYKIYAKDRSPLLICANHLTYVDPPVIIWALAWHIWYVFHFRSLSWNLAATEYRKNPFFRAVLFFAKGIYINRQGGKNHYDQVLGVARQLMLRGEPVTIFPEGRRSRTGRAA